MAPNKSRAVAYQTPVFFLLDTSRDDDFISKLLDVATVCSHSFHWEPEQRMMSSTDRALSLRLKTVEETAAPSVQRRRSSTDVVTPETVENG